MISESDSGFLSIPTKLSYDDLQKCLRNLQSRMDLNPWEQVASYTLETLSTNALKGFTIGLLVVNDKVELWYFDRAGPIIDAPVPLATRVTLNRSGAGSSIPSTPIGTPAHNTIMSSSSSVTHHMPFRTVPSSATISHHSFWGITNGYIVSLHSTL